MYNKTISIEMEINKKYARTTQGQLRWYISFCKDNPELMQGKNTPRAPIRIPDLWQEIATNLNAMVGPSRTPDAWRESMRNWKKQLRSRARKLVLERRRTGGGHNPVSELTEFEQLALETFGIAAVEGHSNSRLGFQSDVQNIAPTRGEESAQETTNTEGADLCVVVSGSPSRAPLVAAAENIVSPAPSCSATPNPVSPGLLVPRRGRKSRRDIRDEILETVQQDMRERRAEQSRLAQSLDSLGSGLASLAGAIHELVALQSQHRN